VSEFPYGISVPLDRRTVTRFTRKDLEAFARVQLCQQLPGHLVIPASAVFSYALTENPNLRAQHTHLMRVRTTVAAVREVA